ncbi:MAG TPA: hypothetical protein VM029_10045 [Opitutaceae bacterium]|nr:hypothetical protein [Opitutaceae bacterium]
MPVVEVVVESAGDCVPAVDELRSALATVSELLLAEVLLGAALEALELGEALDVLELA